MLQADLGGSAMKRNWGVEIQQWPLVGAGYEGDIDLSWFIYLSFYLSTMCIYVYIYIYIHILYVIFIYVIKYVWCVHIIPIHIPLIHRYINPRTAWYTTYPTKPFNIPRKISTSHSPINFSGAAMFFILNNHWEVSPSQFNGMAATSCDDDLRHPRDPKGSLSGDGPWSQGRKWMCCLSIAVLIAWSSALHPKRDVMDSYHRCHRCHHATSICRWC